MKLDLILKSAYHPSPFNPQHFGSLDPDSQKYAYPRCKIITKTKNTSKNSNKRLIKTTWSPNGSKRRKSLNILYLSKKISESWRNVQDQNPDPDKN